MDRTFLLLGAIAGFLAVTLGAFGAHGLRGRLSPEMMAVYQEVRQGLEDAIARGLAPPIDSDYLACACIGIAQEVGTAMLRRSPPDVEAAAAFAAGLILKGIDGAPRSG